MMKIFYFLFLFSIQLSSSVWAEEWKVREIEVVPPSQAEVVNSILPIQVGDYFDSQVGAISKRLLDTTNKFQSVSIDPNAAEGRLKVVVKPREYIDQIIWSDDSLKNQSAIQSTCVQANELVPVTSERLSEIKECLQKAIQGVGYLDAKITVDIKDLNLHINVTKGDIYRIGNIEFSGRDKLPEINILDVLKNKPGNIFLLKELDADTKRILKAYQDDGFYFAQIFQPSIQADPERKQISLNWKIQESYPMDIQFTGHRKSRSRIYELIEREQPFPKWFLDEILDSMRNDLIQDGYLDGTVKVSREIDKDGVEHITIHTRQGPRYRLINPEWVGISSKSEVESLYKDISEFKLGAPFKEEEIRRLLGDDFVKLAMSKGYLDARFKDVDFQINKKLYQVKPIIYFSEGEQYRIEKNSVEGIPDIGFKTQEWKDLQEEIETGQIFDFLKIDRLRIDLQRKLIALGYLDAKIEQFYTKTNGKIDLKINAVSGPRYIVQRVLIRGAIKTDYRVLRQEIVLEPGDYYEEEKVRDSVSQILRLSITRSVDIQPIEKDSETGKVFALVDIVEAPRFRIEFGPGYGTADGLRGVFKATYANIGGRARRINFYAKGSRLLIDQDDPTEAEYFRPESLPIIQRRIGIEYFEPSLFNWRLDGRLNFTHSKEEKSAFGQKNSFTAAVDYRFSRRWIFTTFYELAFSDPFNILRDGKTTDADVAPKRFTSVGEIAVIDFLDDSFSPTKGWRTRLEIDFYDSRLGGEVNIWQSLIKQEYFRPIYTFRKGKFVGFALSVSSGFTGSFEETKVVPVEKRLRVGGENSVRGFGEGGIKPRLSNGKFQDGGESFLSFMTEFNFPIFSSVDLLAFFDGGNAYLTNKEFKPWKLRYGAGPGFRINTAVGPLKFGYGFVLFRREGDPFGSFYIGVGAI